MNYTEIEIEGMKEILRDKEKEIKKLNEFKTKREEMMFLIGASIELAKPKTSWDAEKLQKGKELYEKLYKEELHYLEEENKELKERIRFLEQCLDNKEKVNNQLRKDIKWYEKEEDKLREENKKLREELDLLKKQQLFSL